MAATLYHHVFRMRVERSPVRQLSQEGPHPTKRIVNTENTK